MKQVQKPLQEAILQGESRVEISLSPRNLGSVTVEITRSGDGSLHVLFGASSEQTMNLLEKNSAGLRMLLADSNQAPVRIEVQNAKEQQSGGQFLNPEDGGQGRGQQQQRREERGGERSQDFIQQLRLGLIQPEAV